MANVLPMRTPAETALIERFQAEQAGLPGAAEARAEAFARFEKAGLPSRRVEAYHYTDVRNILRNAGSPWPHDPADARLAPTEETRIDFFNGRFHSARNLPDGVECHDLGTALTESKVELGAGFGHQIDTIVDLNTALVREGVFLRIAPNAAIAEPISIASGVWYKPSEHLPEGSGLYAAPRVVVEVGAGASVTLSETHSGPDGIAYQKNSVVELVLGAGAKVQHIRVNEAGDKALMLSTLAARLGAGAELMSLNLTSGGETSRHQVFVTYAGENAVLDLRGATMIKGRQHADNTLVVDHAVPHGTSRELFRAVIDGEAQGVFQGKIIVRPHAQKTDGQMASNAVLLSDGAAMANKPELEIFADDVVCAHGATAGALEESQLFYLMARGLPRTEAEALLVEAFLGEAIDGVFNDGLREVLAERVSNWLAKRAEAL